MDSGEMWPKKPPDTSVMREMGAFFLPSPSLNFIVVDDYYKQSLALLSSLAHTSYPVERGDR